MSSTPPAPISPQSSPSSKPSLQTPSLAEGKSPTPEENGGNQGGDHLDKTADAKGGEENVKQERGEGEEMT